MGTLVRTAVLFSAGMAIAAVGAALIDTDFAETQTTDGNGVAAHAAVGLPQEEYVFVFIGSSVCGAANLPYLPDAIAAAKDGVAARAEEDGARLHTIGVARDRSIDAGLEHLRKFGHFDEVAAGAGWGNSAINRYIYETFPGPGVTPQIVVVKREVALGRGIVSQPRVLVRKVGAAEIRRWAVDQSAVLPSLSPEDEPPN
jgi:hypothetical protein